MFLEHFTNFRHRNFLTKTGWVHDRPCYHRGGGGGTHVHFAFSRLLIVCWDVGVVIFSFNWYLGTTVGSQHCTAFCRLLAVYWKAGVVSFNTFLGSPVRTAMQFILKLTRITLVNYLGSSLTVIQRLG